MKLKFKHSILMCFLFLTGLCVGMVGYQESYFTSLSETTALPKTQNNRVPILPGSPYQGEFTASYNRLGTVRIRVSTGGRINKNSLVFRLREKGSEQWIVENTYVTDRFIDGEKYPFGFPVIFESQGKVYDYELSTVDGSAGNTISVVPGTYAFQTDYMYSKALIVSNRQTMVWFVKEKGKELFGSIPHIGFWIMCLLPVLFLTNVYVPASILMISLFAFLPVEIHSNMVLWIGLSVFAIVAFKKNSQLPFVLLLFSLGVCGAAYACQGFGVAARIATLIPVFLTVGAGAVLWSLKS